MNNVRLGASVVEYGEVEASSRVKLFRSSPMRVALFGAAGAVALLAVLGPTEADAKPVPTPSLTDGPKPRTPCKECNTDCDLKRGKCVPKCGADRVHPTDPQKKCVLACFVTAEQCHRECKKTKCREKDD